MYTMPFRFLVFDAHFETYKHIKPNQLTAAAAAADVAFCVCMSFGLF